MNTRQFWTAFAFGICFDVLVSAIVGLLSPDYSKFTNAFIVFFALIIIPALVAFYSLIKQWVHYWIFGKETLKRSYLKILKGNDMPNPKGEFDIDAYLASTCDISRLAQNERTSIALTMELQALKATRLSAYIQGQMAASAALALYDATFVRSED
jgi:hypothetical protein